MAYISPYIIFNGTSSEDLGFVVEKLPDEHRAKRNIEETQIPGRPGRLITDLGSYDIYQTKLTLNCFGHPIGDVNAWLQGEGWLTTSEDPEHMRWVAFYDQFTDSRFRCDGLCYDSVTIPLRAWPYKHLAVQEPIVRTEPDVFRGMGNANASPVIEVTGSGNINLMVNDATVLIDGLDGAITIDCDARTAYREVGGVRSFAGRMVTLADDDDWPELKPEVNLLNWSGDVREVRITPWWRWL